MNILIVNDDGSGAYGLRVLSDAAHAKWPRARIVTIVPKSDMSGCGSSIKPTVRPGQAKLKKIANHTFEAPAGVTPVDVVNHAMVRRDDFVSDRRPWDLVLCGVNHGKNVGLGVLSSGTVYAAVYAAKAFDVPAWAFSQRMPDGKRPKSDADLRAAFRNARRYLPQFLENQQPAHSPGGGECYSVCFPPGDSSTGWMNCEVAPYSPAIGPEFTPLEARKHPYDVEYLDQGYVTVAEVELNLTPPMRY